MNDTTKPLIFAPDSANLSIANKKALLVHLKEKKLVADNCTILNFKDYVVKSPSKEFDFSRDIISEVKNCILDMVNTSEILEKGGKNISLYYIPVSNPHLSNLFTIQLMQMAFKSETNIGKRIGLYSPVFKHDESGTRIESVISFSEAAFAGRQLRTMSQPLRVFLYDSKKNINFTYGNGDVKVITKDNAKEGKAPDGKQDVLYFELEQSHTAAAYIVEKDMMIFAPRRVGNKKEKKESIKDFKALSLKSPELASKLFNVPIEVIEFIVKSTA